VADLDTQSPNLYFVHADHLDRPVKMTDVNKAVVWDAVYNPFGDVNSITGSATNNLRFPGQYFLIESGLHYNWYRHYEPTLGRYLQPDPLGFIDGPSVYAYASNNPISNKDPTGLKCVPGVGCWTTPTEAALANAGQYSAYYALACASGDAYACFAGHVANDDNFWGTLATDWLNRAIDKVGRQNQQCMDTPGILNRIRTDLAREYANYLPNSEQNARWPTALGISQFHWSEFAQFGLPPSAFGGTPFGSAVGPVLPSIWCPNCR
jgi:RHS repeat-associated protein